MFRRTALIAAAAVVTAGLALTGCSAGSAGAGSAAGSAAQSAPGLNTPVTVGDFEFTVTGAKDAGTTLGTAPLTKTAQGSFFEVDLVVKNVGDSSETFLSQNVKLVDASGKTFDVDPTATLYAAPGAQSWVAAINPGNSITGPVLFDVPAGTQAVSVQVSDSMFSKGKTIDLG